VAIERFIWTEHAERRLRQRRLTRAEVEQAIRDRHGERQINRGDADWRIHGSRADGRRFAVIYDNPVKGDRRTVRIVSAWPLRRAKRS